MGFLKDKKIPLISIIIVCGSIFFGRKTYNHFCGNSTPQITSITQILNVLVCLLTSGFIWFKVDKYLTKTTSIESSTTSESDKLYKVECELAVNDYKEISVHKKILLDWFEKEKPYLRKNFRLSDLNERIPVNRTYLSRLINDEFSINFNSLITEYRLKESCEVIRKNPSTSIKEVADKCGFSSTSVYSRAFVAHYNITPSKYRDEIKKSTKKNNTGCCLV